MERSELVASRSPAVTSGSPVRGCGEMCGDARTCEGMRRGVGRWKGGARGCEGVRGDVRECGGCQGGAGGGQVPRRPPLACDSGQTFYQIFVIRPRLVR